jgi:molecular chaperone DnaJ
MEINGAPRARQRHLAEVRAGLAVAHHLVATEHHSQELAVASVSATMSAILWVAAPQEVDVTITLTEAISGVSRQLTIVGGRQPITFNVPASIKDGAKLRLPATASRPEIIATVHITNPYGFDRKEDNLIVDVSVPFTTCAMGGEITAVTPSGERKTLRLPAGTQGGQQLRITGHGMTKGAGNPRGDMLVRIKIEVPKNLTDRQRAALDELAAALEDSK